MRQYIDVGTSPCEEPCIQVNSRDDGYMVHQRAECQLFIHAIKTVLGEPPKGATLSVKSNPHDFGTYYEVVCYYDGDNDAAIDYAYSCEGDSPGTWEAAGMDVQIANNRLTDDTIERYGNLISFSASDLGYEDALPEMLG